jgi:hypothetical protein
MENQRQPRKPKKFLYTEAQDRMAKRDRTRLLEIKKLVSMTNKITSQIRK